MVRQGAGVGERHGGGAGERHGEGHAAGDDLEAEGRPAASHAVDGGGDALVSHLVAGRQRGVAVISCTFRLLLRRGDWSWVRALRCAWRAELRCLALRSGVF